MIETRNKPSLWWLDSLGISAAQIEQRIQSAWQSLFYGSENERLFWPDGHDGGYMVDTGNDDVRTEGQSYGMMMAVQMNDREVFDRIWRWTHSKMLFTEGPQRGYFAWSVRPDGVTNRAGGPAPDGEEYFALALFFASHRWGDGPAPLNYSEQAKEILRTAVHKGENEPGQPLWEPANALIKFVPNCPWTDPSYHLPHFYRLFADWADQGDRAFWLRAEQASLEYLVTACHPLTGMAPEYADYDGQPHQADWGYGHHHFYSDSYRVAANIGLDALWFGSDANLQKIVGKLLNFFDTQNPQDLRQYVVDGTPLNEPAMHPLGLLAANAMGAMAIQTPEALRAIQRFWNEPLRSGKRRYYDNCLAFFSLLALGGHFRIY